MYKKIILMTFAVLFLYRFPLYPQSFPDDLPGGKPKKILTDKRDRFFVDYSSSVAVFTNRVEYVVKPRDPKKGYRTFLYDNVVSTNGVVSSIVTSSYRPRKSKTTYYHLTLVTCYGPSDYKYRRLYYWSNTSGGSSYRNYQLSSFKISEKNNLFYKIDYFSKRGKRSERKAYYYMNGRKVSKSSYDHYYSVDFPKPSSGVSMDGKTSFLIDGNKDYSIEESSSRYKHTVIMDKKEIPHVFFHNVKNRAFYHRFYSRDRERTIETLVDGPESGQENIAFLSGNRIWSIHYFYRDSFNKGLLVTVSETDTGNILKKFVIDASKTRNSGWDLIGAKSSGGRVLFSYLSDKIRNKREYVLLGKVEDLEYLGENLKNTGDLKGGEFSKEDERKGEDLSRSFLKDKRSFQLNLGAGLQYVFWETNVATPDSDSGVSDPYKPEYEFSDSFMNIFSIEGRYENTNLGLDFVTKYIDREVEQDNSEANSLNSWRGWIGYDRLFFDFDVKLEYETSNTKVFFQDKSGQVADREFNLEYQQIKLSLLPFKRHHFGLLYQNYNFYQPVYIYKVNAGSTSYNFEDKAIGEIDVYNFALHYGYSTSDYLVKYETEYNDWFFDGEIRFGLSLADYNGDLSITGNKEPDTEPTYILGGVIEFGWIWYKRIESLNQTGFLVKLSYRIDGAQTGSSDKPGDKDEASSSDDYYFGYERSELRHGPMVFVSFNF